MNWVLPAICFFLALMLLVAGFAVCSTGPPEPTVELHRARLGEDRQYREVMERQFENRQLGRKTLIACLFGGSVVMVVTAFMTMRPAESQGRR